MSTVSKTTTQDEIRNLLTLGAGGGVCGDYYDVVERLAKFCDSLTAELQKENARLREALEKIVPYCGLTETECEIKNCPSKIARAALSKEKK